MWFELLEREGLRVQTHTLLSVNQPDTKTRRFRPQQGRKETRGAGKRTLQDLACLLPDFEDIRAACLSHRMKSSSENYVTESF